MLFRSLGVEVLAELQDMLYAQDKWAVLLVFQAMDAAGKDGAIKHVMSGVNPQGCQVCSFKAPTSEELDLPSKIKASSATIAGSGTEKKFRISVKSGAFGAPRRVSNSEYTVFASKMTPTIQRIQRSGGKISSIEEII